MCLNHTPHSHSHNTHTHAHISLIPRAHFHSAKLKAHQRIGPHQGNIQDLLVGALLGDGWAEKRSHATRFRLKQSSTKVAYVRFMGQSLARAGLCADLHPKLYKIIGKQGKIYHSAQYTTWSFSSLNYLYDSFYGEDGVKKVPHNIKELLTARALAYWIMDDGSLGQGGRMRISTESFTFPDCDRLRVVLQDKFQLVTTIHSHIMSQGDRKPVIYLAANQIAQCRRVCLEYAHPTMYYKWGVTT